MLCVDAIIRWKNLYKFSLEQRELQNPWKPPKSPLNETFRQKNFCHSMRGETLFPYSSRLLLLFLPLLLSSSLSFSVLSGEVQFSWSPSAAQAGSYLVCLVARNMYTISSTPLCLPLLVSTEINVVYNFYIQNIP